MMITVYSPKRQEHQNGEKKTLATATSAPVCSGAEVCAAMEAKCGGGANRKCGLYLLVGWLIDGKFV
jgi:hypothetical protein